MKIIAKTEKGYLAEVDEKEIANLIGCYGTYEVEFRNLLSASKDNLTGVDIDVNQIYSMATMLRGLNKEDIADAKKELKNTQEKLGELENIVNKMTLLTTLKEA